MQASACQTMARLSRDETTRAAMFEVEKRTRGTSSSLGDLLVALLGEGALKVCLWHRV